MQFFPLVATNEDGDKIHQGLVGRPIIFQHTTSNDEVEALDFELQFTTRLPDDAIVDEKTIPVHLAPNETKTVTHQFVPTKEGNFVTTVFTELFADSVAFPVLDDSKNYKKEIVMIHTFPYEKNCSRVCTNPSELTVNVGTVVEWLNTSPSDQTISTGIYNEDEKGTSFTYDNKFQSRIAPDSKFSYLFLEPGDYKYYFSDHRFLQFAGIIHVLPPSQSPPQELLDKARNTIEPAQQVIEYKPSPLLQHKQGIPNDEIVCYNHLQPIIKKYNNTPACVKYDSIYKLVNRGWAAQEKLETSGPAFEAARVYIENSPTFRFDGLFGVLDTILVSNDTAYPPNFVLKSHFSSKYKGFGDRTHQELIEDPVYHEIVLHINGVNITSAIIDGVWDEKGQKMIEDKQIITTNEEKTSSITEKKSINLSHVENDPKYGSCKISFMFPGDDYNPQREAPPFPIEFVGKTVGSFDEAQKITGIRNLILPTHIPECLKLRLIQVDDDPNLVGINLYYLLEDISLDDLEYVNEVSNKGLIVTYHKDQPAPFFDWKEYAQAQAAAIGKRGKTIEFNNTTILLYDRNPSQLSYTGARAFVDDTQVSLSSKIIDITEMENIIKSIFPQ
ncbi:MAG: cupredoxin domain-containing protein [Nitrosopumilaceae archaeon]